MSKTIKIVREFCECDKPQKQLEPPNNKHDIVYCVNCNCILTTEHKLIKI